MTIGDMRIAEWSHNGACRFWLNYSTMSNHPKSRLRAVPELYAAEYDGNRLRTTIGPIGFEYLSHVSGWQRNFAALIYHRTGIAHPTWGSGK